VKIVITSGLFLAVVAIGAFGWLRLTDHPVSPAPPPEPVPVVTASLQQLYQRRRFAGVAVAYLVHHASCLSLYGRTERAPWPQSAR
jgi:multidrug efflux pump subunit AcrA (membrane-fusion protein)